MLDEHINASNHDLRQYPTQPDTSEAGMEMPPFGFYVFIDTEEG